MQWGWRNRQICVLQTVTANLLSKPFGGGIRDMFIVQFDNQRQMQWGTYWGGTEDDRIRSYMQMKVQIAFMFRDAGWSQIGTVYKNLAGLVNPLFQGDIIRMLVILKMCPSLSAGCDHGSECILLWRVEWKCCSNSR